MKVISIAVIMLLVLCSCSASESVVGKWKHDSTDAVYQFNSDGTFTMIITGFEPVEGTYQQDTEEKTLVLTVEDNVQSSIYELFGNQLRLTSPDTGAIVTLTKIN